MAQFLSPEGSSPLIAPELEAQLRTLLAPINVPTEIVCIGEDSEKSCEMACFLTHIASLCEKLSLRLVKAGEDAQADAALDASLLPATGFHTENGYSRAVFHGVPGGKELTGFVMALLKVGGAGKPVDKPTLKDISRIDKPAKLQICVSLGCHHCAKVVVNAQTIAEENPLVSAHMIDANLYPELVAKYDIQRVPVLIADGAVLASGEQTLPEMCTLLRKRK